MYPVTVLTGPWFGCKERDAQSAPVSSTQSPLLHTNALPNSPFLTSHTPVQLHTQIHIEALSFENAKYEKSYIYMIFIVDHQQQNTDWESLGCFEPRGTRWSKTKMRYILFCVTLPQFLIYYMPTCAHIHTCHQEDPQALNRYPVFSIQKAAVSVGSTFRAKKHPNQKAPAHWSALF